MATKTPVYDSAVPEALKHVQTWFGSIIERPIDLESCMMPIAPSGRSMIEEAADYITASPTLEPHQRIELYNQQYWWRLLNIMHETYPLVTRLFGYVDFNQKIAFPYICRYRPNHWSLSFLGARLPQWVKRYYKEDDKQLIYHAAALDDAYNEAFLIKAMPPVNMQAIKRKAATQGLLEQKLYLQAHLYLFEMPYNLFEFRETFIEPEDGDHWMDRPFPNLDQEGPYFFALFRDPSNCLRWLSLAEGEYRLLQQYRKGNTTSAVVEWLSEQEDAWTEDAATHLHTWLQTWILRGWFAHKRPPAKRK